MSHYFLVASLPLLAFEAPPPLGVPELRERCTRWLAAEDLDALDAILENRAHAQPFVQGWRAADTQLRNAVARVRAARASRDAAATQRTHTGFDVRLEREATEAMHRATPLDTEREIDAVRWRVAGELAGPDPFSLEAVLAYALRLRIAERWAGLDVTQGRAAVQDIVARELAAHPVGI